MRSAADEHFVDDEHRVGGDACDRVDDALFGHNVEDGEQCCCVGSYSWNLLGVIVLLVEQMLRIGVGWERQRRNGR